MFKLSYKVNGEVKEVVFDHNFELIRFVAVSGIKDEDFVSLTIGEKEINGMAGLVNEALEVADKMEESYNFFTSMDEDTNEEEDMEEDIDEEE